MRPTFLSAAMLCTLSMLSLSSLAHGGSENTAPPAGVQDLVFSDYYVMPVGPLGLEPTEKLLALRAKRVRLVGYMVHEEEPASGVFMLTPRPVQLAEVADGPADDLPATTVFVHLPAHDQQRVIPYRAGPWVLTGTLELGAQPESNQRMSYTRLRLAPVPREQAAAPSPRARAQPQPQS